MPNLPNRFLGKVAKRSENSDKALGRRVDQAPQGTVTSIDYVARPGFYAMEEALERLSSALRKLIDAQGFPPAEGMWFCSVQTYKSRVEAEMLRMGDEQLFVATAKRPMTQAGMTSDGRPRLAPSGPWSVDCVRLPFVAGTLERKQFLPGPMTVPGGDQVDLRDVQLATELSNLPNFVQRGIEQWVPRAKRLRRWTRCLGPTAVSPERLWLFTTSDEHLAYVYGQRPLAQDPSGLEQPRNTVPWKLAVQHVVIGSATREIITVEAG